MLRRFGHCGGQRWAKTHTAAANQQLRKFPPAQSYKGHVSRSFLPPALTSSPSVLIRLKPGGLGLDVSRLFISLHISFFFFSFPTGWIDSGFPFAWRSQICSWWINAIINTLNKLWLLNPVHEKLLLLPWRHFYNCPGTGRKAASAPLI